MQASGEDVLLVDAGDLLGGEDEFAGLRTRCLLAAMGQLDQSAVALGERDLLRGVEFIRSAAESSGVPLVVSNVVTLPGDRPLGAPYVMRRIGARRLGPFQWGGYRAGIFAVLADHGLPAVPRAVADSIRVDDPFDAARRMVRELRDVKGCRFVAALAHMGPRDSRRLAQEVPGIDLVIVGHGSGRIERPEVYGDCVLVQAGDLGAELGHARFNVRAQGPVVLEDNRVKILDADVPPDPEIEPLLGAYRETVERLESARRAERGAAGSDTPGVVRPGS